MPIGSPISSISLRSVFCSETIRVVIVDGSEASVSCCTTRRIRRRNTPPCTDRAFSCRMFYERRPTVRRRSRVSGESTVELRGLLLGATLRREPVGTVREVILSILWGHDVVNALASQGGRTGSDR